MEHFIFEHLYIPNLLQKLRPLRIVITESDDFYEFTAEDYRIMATKKEGNSNCHIASKEL